MPDLDFTIRTRAELEGAQQVGAELERLIGKQKALGEDYSENAAKLAKVNGSLEEFRKQNQGAGEGVDYFNTRGREMNRLINMVERQAPGAGEVLRAAFRPETLGIAAVILLLEQMVKWIGAAKKEADDLRESQDKLTTDVWENQQKQANAAATAAQGYADNIQHAGENLDELKPKYDAQKTLLDAEIEQNNQLTAALEKQAIALIAANPNLTDAQKKQAEAETRASFDSKKSQDQLAAEESQIKLQQKLLSDRITASRDLKAKSDAAEAVHEDALKMSPRLGPEIDFFKSDLGKDPAETVRKAAEKLKKEQKQLGPDPTNADAAYLQELKEKLETYSREKQLVDENQAALDAHTVKVNELKKAADRAVRAYDENATAITEQTEQLTTAYAVLKIHTDTAGQLQEIKDTTSSAETEKDRQGGVKKRISELEAGPEGEVAKKDIQNATYSADLFTAGGKITDGQAKEMVALATLLTGHVQNLNTSAQIFEELKKSSDMQLAFLGKILSDASNFQTRLIALEQTTGLGH